MGSDITCRALALKTADPAQSMYIRNRNKQIWAIITSIGPQVLLSDWPTIYNHASCIRLVDTANPFKQFQYRYFIYIYELR